MAPTSPSTLDFQFARVNGVVDTAALCYGPAGSGSPDVDRVLSALRSARGDNMYAMYVCAGVAVVALLVVWYSVRTIVAVIQDWRSHFVNSPGVPKDLDPDNVAYMGESGTAYDDDLPPEPEATAVAARVARLTFEYGAYNEAMKRYSANRGDLPDDLIDRHILSRGDDDFRYPHQKRDDRIRFRKGEGRGDDLVYLGGGVGLRTS